MIEFIRSPTIDGLCGVLRWHPGIYWHPILLGEIAYLTQALRDRNLWRSLGWGTNRDEVSVQLAGVRTALKDIVAAHAEGLMPGSRVKWASRARKRGPKGRIENPFPSDPAYSYITASELAAADDDLGEYLSGLAPKTFEVDRADRNALMTLEPLIRQALDHRGPI